MQPRRNSKGVESQNVEDAYGELLQCFEVAIGRALRLTGPHPQATWRAMCLILTKTWTQLCRSAEWKMPPSRMLTSARNHLIDAPRFPKPGSFNSEIAVVVNPRCIFHRPPPPIQLPRPIGVKIGQNFFSQGHSVVIR
eukprot:c2588_g1_i1.p1 GENE.c2588_g1_i1~~c2588_g1_i1.p1  ORF type:complete len:138 (-),score=12.43 c2588_g1_i1:450-863(-)